MGFKVKDHYYNKAKKENFLARSVYKLEEIDKKYKILEKNQNVLDLGYYPGSWTQYTSKKILPKGRVIGVDIQEINKKLVGLPNVKLFQEDINDITDLSQIGMDDLFDVVISDMAPKTTGVKTVDQLKSLSLVEWVFSLLPKFLKENGNFVIKVFDSNDAQVFLKSQKKSFKEYSFLKPKSTRSVSKEFFVIGKGYIK